MWHRRTASASPKRRTVSRGWGPFSGGQLTTIICVIVVTALFPVTSWATTGSAVFLTDPHNNHHASIDAAGEVQTHPNGTQAVNGTVKVAGTANVSGTVTVAGTANVSGSVTATPTVPSASYNSFSIAGETVGCSSETAPVPVGEALIITSITVRVASVGTGPVSVYGLSATPGSPCGALTTVDAIDISGAGVSDVMSFPSGVPIGPGHVVGISLGSNSGNAIATVAVHGYLVSSTLCTVTGPPAGCD
jgi:hypothetical protein